MYREPTNQAGEDAGRSTEPLAGLQWQRGETEILLIYSPTRKGQTHSTRTDGDDERMMQLGIRISTKQCLPDALRREMLPGLAPARGNDRWEMFQDLKSKANPPLFE